MSAWSGGPCPKCGEEVPPKVLRCPECRALLNSDFSDHEFAAPEFAPLAEYDGPPPVRPKAERTRCPNCTEELRVNAKYANVPVACKKCGGRLVPGDAANRISWFADCPHCEEEIRVAVKYEGELVGCKFCGGRLRVEPARR